MLAEPEAQTIQIEVDDRRGVKRKHLAHDQSADDGDSERTAQLRACSPAERKGQGPKQRRHGGHQNGPKTQRQAWKMASSELLPSLRSASSAKSIIRMAFFLTMPISKMMPIRAMMLRSGVSDQQSQNRADARRRQRRQNGDRVNIAFIEDARARCTRPAEPSMIRNGSVDERDLKGLQRSRKHAVDEAGMPMLLFHRR